MRKNLCYLKSLDLWYLVAATGNGYITLCSIRIKQRKLFFSHLFHFLEVSIYKVSCFVRIPISLVLFNNLRNKQFQFLPVAEESLVWSRNEFHYPWEDIIELFKKNKITMVITWCHLSTFKDSLILSSLLFSYTPTVYSSCTPLFFLNPLPDISAPCKRYSALDFSLPQVTAILITYLDDVIDFIVFS